MSISRKRVVGAMAAVVLPTVLLTAPSAAAEDTVGVDIPSFRAGAGQCVAYTGGSAGFNQYGPYVNTGSAYTYAC